MSSTDKLTGKYITEEQAASLFPRRPSDSHKGTFGYVALIGGSLEYSGAIRLAARANAAMRSGAGVATVAAPRSICPLIVPHIMEATLYPLSDHDGRIVFSEEEFRGLTGRYDCIAFGMGIGDSDETLKAVRYLLTDYDRKLIVDADGINAMSRLDREIIRNTRADLVLTPHVKEFSRLSGMDMRDIKADPVNSAAALAEELNATVLLKGSVTTVAGADGRVLLTDRGCAGMATAGSGDVLSGILAALCANTDDMVLAAAAGAYINGAAGELAQSRRSDVTMTSADTAACTAEVIESLIRSAGRQVAKQQAD